MVGILALQGDIELHAAILEQLHQDWIPVKSADDLNKTDRLIIPGGESGVMLRLLLKNNLFKQLQEYKKPILGTCAGAILLADTVQNPVQQSLGKIDIVIARNAYGSQLDSFTDKVKFNGSVFPVAFIRAPKITKVGEGIDVLIEHNNDPILVESGAILVATFHPEVTNSIEVHKYFIKK